MFIIQLVDFTPDKFTEKKENATNPLPSCTWLYWDDFYYSGNCRINLSIYQSAPGKRMIKVEILGCMQLLCIIKKQTLEVQLGITWCCSGKCSPKCIHFTEILKLISRWNILIHLQFCWTLCRHEVSLHFFPASLADKPQFNLFCTK